MIRVTLRWIEMVEGKGGAGQTINTLHFNGDNRVTAAATALCDMVGREEGQLEGDFIIYVEKLAPPAAE